MITEGFLWNRSGGLKPLGFLYDHILSEAFGLNDHQQVVGLSCNASECRAFLWENGVMQDLNTLIAPDAKVLLTHAMDINNEGVIAGRATIKSTGELVTYMARPIQTIAAGDVPARTHANRPPSIMLSSETLGQILHPLGPGVARLRSAR